MVNLQPNLEMSRVVGRWFTDVGTPFSGAAAAAAATHLWTNFGRGAAAVLTMANMTV